MAVSNSFIQSERLVGAVGLDNLFIVDTPDALLVADRSRAQDVKNMDASKASGHESHKLHRTVDRPWGTYTVLEEARFQDQAHRGQAWRLAFSLQMHHHRSEHWIVVSGMAKIVNGDKNC